MECKIQTARLKVALSQLGSSSSTRRYTRMASSNQPLFLKQIPMLISESRQREPTLAPPCFNPITCVYSYMASQFQPITRQRLARLQRVIGSLGLLWRADRQLRLASANLPRTRQQQPRLQYAWKQAGLQVTASMQSSMARSYLAFSCSALALRKYSSPRTALALRLPPPDSTLILRDSGRFFSYAFINDISSTQNESHLECHLLHRHITLLLCRAFTKVQACVRHMLLKILLRMGPTASHEIYPFSNQNFDKMVASPNDNVMRATVTVQSQAQLSKWASALLQFAKLKNHPILLPMEFKTVSRTPCGEQSSVEISYECFYVNFAQEIETRRKREHHFQEKELWYLLLTLVEAAQAAQQFGCSLGDPKPSNLLLNRDGQIRLLATPSLPNFQLAYHRDPLTNSLLAPQQLLNRQRGFKSNEANYLIAESFSIGMCLLAAGTLSDASALYDYPANQLNQIQFNKLSQYWSEFSFYSEAQKAKTTYSRHLKSFVLNLLKLDPHGRMRSLQLNAILQNYRHQIMSLQPFAIEERILSSTQPRNNSSSAKSKTHQLQSRRKSFSKESPNSSFFAPTFNSNDLSFQLPLNISSEVYHSGKKNTSSFGGSSNRQKLHVTASFQEKESPK